MAGASAAVSPPCCDSAAVAGVPLAAGASAAPSVSPASPSLALAAAAAQRTLSHQKEPQPHAVQPLCNLHGMCGQCPEAQTSFIRRPKQNRIVCKQHGNMGAFTQAHICIQNTQNACPVAVQGAPAAAAFCRARFAARCAAAADFSPSCSSAASATCQPK